MKKFLLVVAAMAIAFVVGYMPQLKKLQDAERRWEAENEALERRIAALETQHEISQLHSLAAMLLVEVDRKNFGKAQGWSTRLFDRLTQLQTQSEDARQNQMLTAVSRQRDALTAELAQAGPGAQTKAEMIFSDLAKAAEIELSAP